MHPNLLAWVRTEIAEMFAEGVTNAFALQPRLEALKLKLRPEERAVLDRCEAEFLVSFRRAIEAIGGGRGLVATRLSRSLFVKTLLVLLLTTRGRPLMALVKALRAPHSLIQAVVRRVR